MTAYEQTWDVLADVLEHIHYTRDEPPHGRFRLVRDDENNHARLDVFTYNPNSYRPDEMRHTRHEFVVPVATYHRQAWIRWVADRLASIEMHEFGECFRVDGVPVYAHHHGNGWDPYTAWYDGHPAEQAKAPGDD